MMGNLKILAKGLLPRNIISGTIILRNIQVDLGSNYDFNKM